MNGIRWWFLRAEIYKQYLVLVMRSLLYERYLLGVVTMSELTVPATIISGRPDSFTHKLEACILIKRL